MLEPTEKERKTSREILMGCPFSCKKIYKVDDPGSVPPISDCYKPECPNRCILFTSQIITANKKPGAVFTNELTKAELQDLFTVPVDDTKPSVVTHKEVLLAAEVMGQKLAQTWENVWNRVPPLSPPINTLPLPLSGKPTTTQQLSRTEQTTTPMEHIREFIEDQERERMEKEKIIEEFQNERRKKLESIVRREFIDSHAIIGIYWPVGLIVSDVLASVREHGIATSLISHQNEQDLSIWFHREQYGQFLRHGQVLVIFNGDHSPICLVDSLEAFVAACNSDQAPATHFLETCQILENAYKESIKSIMRRQGTI